MFTLQALGQSPPRDSFPHRCLKLCFNKAGTGITSVARMQESGISKIGSEYIITYVQGLCVHVCMLHLTYTCMHTFKHQGYCWIPAFQQDS